MKRILIIILDGLGIGELPDAVEYGDSGSNTLKNMADAVEGLNLSNLEMLGLGLIDHFQGMKRPDEIKGFYGKMAEASKAKDTTSGHWEMMGVTVHEPFPVYPKGFPQEIIEPFEKSIKRKILGNSPASGTEIIKELGPEHLRTGSPIIYTSADSVFQIAAHEDVIPVEELYDICKIARNILQNPHNIGRVIARPFTGREGSFERTRKRKDYSIPPFKKTVLEYLAESGKEVVSIGKVWDIFAGKGFTQAVSSSGIDDSISQAVSNFQSIENGLVFVTLVDFDTLYGHRNDPVGFARALERFDKGLPELFSRLSQDDILILTADHGCDPTTPSTDHSREYVPLLVYNPAQRGGVDLGIRESFSDVGATIMDAFGIEKTVEGKSFWKDVITALK